MKEYNKANIPLAKTLRKNMTPWERKLWYDFLRNYPVRFQRQKAIGNYIADFYCEKAKLIVELDGGGHYTEQQTKKDKGRTEELEEMGYALGKYLQNGNISEIGSLPEEDYVKLVQEVKSDGGDKIIAALQRQLDEWLAENPEWQ